MTLCVQVSNSTLL